MKWFNYRICTCYITFVIGAFSALPASAQEATELPDVGEFVQKTYIHGIPYEVAHRYDRSVIPELLDMLRDDQYSQYWPNIVVTLGMIGDESAVDPLIEFLQEGRGEATEVIYAARSSVLLALGYLANKSGSDKALSYLRESVNLAAWSRRKLRWTSPYQDEKGRDEQLSNMAILGLALSGQDSARETLLDLRALTEKEAIDPFARSAAELAESALLEHKLIAEKGMLNYATRQRGPSPEPVGLITGAEKPPEIATGRRKEPTVPRPAMDAPKLPPEPALKEAKAIPDAELQQAPDPDKGD